MAAGDKVYLLLLVGRRCTSSPAQGSAISLDKRCKAEMATCLRANLKHFVIYIKKIGEQPIGQSKAIAQPLCAGGFLIGWPSVTVLERSTPGYIGRRNSCQGKKDKKKRSKNEATWCTPSKLLSQEVNCCLPPTPVYFLEDSRRFYELLSPVLLLLPSPCCSWRVCNCCFLYCCFIFALFCNYFID
ncbi:hypothetical protein LAZ67_1001596 [Cordylochernes scorpioides]|uniref:Uncharacterized protein n=1 Tax=Cordylochernes scorpioides TaxID=51811 RepID=A0ABY6JX29_9ARAC|nr:hypothetical protein LAZ67_1001596 [Cordylochernes scorpioides]